MALDLPERARLFATAAHAATDQRRKFTNEPYINHVAGVVANVGSVPHDEAMLAAAWLHDVVEDTKIGLDTITAEFGEDVAMLVDALTKASLGSDKPKPEKHALDKAKLAGISARAQTIKLADIIDNVGTVRQRDAAYAEGYIAEKADMLAVLDKGDRTLFERAMAHVRG